MAEYQIIIKRYEEQLVKALRHFDYSYKKITKLPTEPTLLDDEALETWESYSSRFSRVVDLFLTKYVRAAVKLNDPGFDGTLRDFVNQGEKLGLVSSAQVWMELRELRNISAHTYEDQLAEFLTKIRLRAGPLIDLGVRMHAT